MINLYCNNPTAGAKDGTAISQDNTQTSPLSLTMKTGEKKAVKCAIRTDEGFKGTNTKITILVWDKDKYDYTEFSSNQNMHNWAIAEDKGYKNEADALTNASWFQHSYNLTGEITDTNRIIWVMYDATKNKEPMSDNTVSICIKSTLEAVEKEDLGE